MMQFVALIQQGMITDQRVIASGPDQEAVLAQAEAAAQKLNEAQQGFGEGWSAVALEMKP